MQDGKLGVYKKYRGNINSVYKQYVKERLQGRKIRPGHIFVTESGEVDEAVLEESYALIRETVPVMEIHHTLAGCTISTHCGPKTLGILFLEE
jgi:fatty acid-binding protein DegV